MELLGYPAACRNFTLAMVAHLRLFKQGTTSTPGIFQDSRSGYLFGQECETCIHRRISASHPGPVEESVKPRTLARWSAQL